MRYASPIQILLCDDRLPSLAVASPVPGVEATLREPIENLFAATIIDREAAQACLAGLWLRYDFVDESHAISQDLETPEGSYWHGILHRREPDYDNAKYWFRRVGAHPIFKPLCATAADLTRAAGVPRGTDFLARQEAWDAFAFIDLCEAVGQGAADEMLCRRIQCREWDLLFEYCYQRALGS